jgi:hypothetical protein
VADFEPRIWTLTIPAPADFVSPNNRGNQYTLARITKDWRDTTYLVARAHKPKLPVGLSRVRIDAILRFDNNNSRDLPNYTDAAKPCIDALGPPFLRGGKKPASAPGYRLIPNDGPRNLDGPHVRFGPNVEPGKPQLMVLIITDLSQVPAGRTWTPELSNSTGGKTLRVKHCCNGCGRRLGDVNDAEIEAAMNGRRIPDVTGECLACTQLSSQGAAHNA